MSDSERTVRFVPLPPAALAALRRADLAAAREAAGVALTPYFVTPDVLGLWRIRDEQVAARPGDAAWIVRAALDDATGDVVGHAGYHGPPDASGMVEVGYSVDPAFRGRGYAKAMLRELLRRAAAEPDVRTVRATISPGNAASLAVVAASGFRHVGEQWDDEDGLELVFERPADAQG